MRAQVVRSLDQLGRASVRAWRRGRQWVAAEATSLAAVTEGESRDPASLGCRIAMLQSAYYVIFGIALLMASWTITQSAPTLRRDIFGVAVETEWLSGSVLSRVNNGSSHTGSESMLGPRASPPVTSLPPSPKRKISSWQRFTVAVAARVAAYPLMAMAVGVLAPTVRHVLDFVLSMFVGHMLLRWLLFGGEASWSSLFFWFFLLLDAVLITVSGEAMRARQDRQQLLRGPMGTPSDDAPADDEGGPQLDSDFTAVEGIR